MSLRIYKNILLEIATILRNARVGLSPFRYIYIYIYVYIYIYIYVYFICFNEEECFLFHLINYFHSQDFCLVFLVMQKKWID